jgi:predicted transcriptional regulator/RimJ/RimL family protein N-acetyltransferase
MEKPVLLVVVRQQFADAIFSGHKKFELRVLPVNTEIRYVLLYTPESKAIVGGFKPQKVYRQPIEKLWKTVEGGGTMLDRFEAYFREAKKGTAILIGSNEKFSSPITLPAIRQIERDFWIPMSFTYLGLDNPVVQSIAQQSKTLKGLLQEPHKSNFDLKAESIHVVKAGVEDWANFERLCRYHIAPSYDEIDATFAESIWASHMKGADPVGYFTKSKTVHRLEMGPERLIIGYTVTTHKRGGSVKFGPTFLLEDYRGQGFGPRVRRQMDDDLRRSGSRKSYCTIPSTNKAALGYLLKADYRIEAHLKAHYSEDHDELVLGKVLTPTASVSLREMRARYSSTPRMREENPSANEIWSLLGNTMRHDYGGIDRSFAESIHLAALRYKQGDYSSKAKRVFTLRDGGKLRGLAVCTPKRGGSVKIAPFICPFGESSGALFMDFIAGKLKEIPGMRKLYVLLPLRDLAMQGALRSRGFTPEGTLVEPYKAGSDIRIMSREETHA